MKEIPTPLVRANQWTAIVSVFLAAAVHPLWLLLPWTAALAGLVGGPGWQPVFRVARVLLGRRVEGAATEDAGAQRFNALLAWLLLGVGLAGLVVLRSPWVGWSAAGAVALAAFLATRGLCIGCALYGWMPVGVRRRLSNAMRAGARP